MGELRREGDGSGRGQVRRTLEWLGVLSPTREARLLPAWVYGALAVFDLVVGAGMVFFQDGFRHRVVGAFVLIVGVPAMVLLARLSHRRRTRRPV